MDFLITPYKSVGPIEFGMTQSDVRKLFVVQPHTITHHSQDLWDVYDLESSEDGTFIGYTKKSPYICRIVALPPSSKVIIPNFDFDLLRTYSIKKLKDILENLGFTLALNSEGIFVGELGIYLYTQSDEVFGDDPPQALKAFVKGYYSRDLFQWSSYNKGMDDFFALVGAC